MNMRFSAASWRYDERSLMTPPRWRVCVNTARTLVTASVILFLWPLRGLPQTDQSHDEVDNLYSAALIASIKEMEKSWGYIDDGDNGSRIRTDYRQMLMRKNPEITNDLPTKFGDHQLAYLDDQALVDKRKTLKKDFSVLEIHPVRNRGPQLKIQVSVSWVGYQGGRLVFAISDWSDVEFRYDCVKQAYTISAVKLGGI